MSKLSTILHGYINKGRNGRTDASDTTGVVLTDEQLCGLWEKATKLESVLSTCRDKAMALAKELSR